GLVKVGKSFGFLTNVYKDKIDTAPFTDTFVLERLKQAGYFLACPQVPVSGPGMFFHCQVIWGVHYIGQSTLANALLHTMNPMNGMYELYPVSYFTDNTPLFTCWKNVGSSSP